eukprot:scaffold184890_cov39-Prasinocladus_malaysianus.AAC.1
MGHYILVLQPNNIHGKGIVFSHHALRLLPWRSSVNDGWPAAHHEIIVSVCRPQIDVEKQWLTQGAAS